ncbi:MAG TPA: methyltransferase domain-containing protein [Bacteroidia bacterium]|nr:methyltransferase domain-containing protein [Bacteroidia bacterium]HNT80562.1 methyltransferase domain-containing protein [Bacteroidia bacterium]
MFDRQYWEDRYHQQKTGWDIGHANPILIDFVVSTLPKDSKILIPGCGNAHEAIALFEIGYANVVILDIAQAPLLNVKSKCPDFPEENMICEDFFFHQSSYDAILEQTFFCAIDPSLRKSYVEKTHRLLKDKAILFGLLFASAFTAEGPPFGGTIDEYQQLFKDKFEFIKLEHCNNSISPRMGNELFIEFIKK